MLQICSGPWKIVLMKYIYIYLHFIGLLIYLFNSLFRLCIVYSWVYFPKSEVTLFLSLLLIFSLLRLEGSGEGGGGGVGRKGSLFCDTPAKKLQNLRPAASKVMILRLQHHQDSQVVIYIGTKPWVSKVINQNAYFGKRWHN